MAGGSIGESPQEGAELVPNADFFTHVLGGGGGGGVPGAGPVTPPPTAPSTRPGASRSLNRGARRADGLTDSAAKLLAGGGFTLPLSDLDPGQVAVSLTAPVAARVRSRVLASGTVRIGANRRGRAKIRLSAVGRRVLRKAKRPVTATVRLTYRAAAGGAPLTKTRRVKIKPPPVRRRGS